MILTNTILSVTLSLFLSTGFGNATNGEDYESKVTEGSALMTKVFHQFHINYEMSRTHKLGYYQEAMEDTEGLHYLAESILDIYVPHNLSQDDHAAIKPIRSRKKVFEKINSDNLLFGNASDMARCSIWRPNSFLSEKNRNNYDFLYSGDTVFKGQDVSVVDFHPSNAKGKVKGTILIEKESNAIVHIDYTPDVSNSKLWSEVTWTEEFFFVEGKYELGKVQFEGLCSKNTYEYSATLVMQHKKVLSSFPDEHAYIDKDVSLFQHAKDDFSDSFWNGYHELRADVDSEHVAHIASK